MVGICKKVLLVISFFQCISAIGQEYPHDIQQYEFIAYDSNRLEFFGDSSGFTKLFKQFDTIVFDGEQQLDILHMGGSHIQAGVFSAQMRKHIQSIQPGLNSYRGFIFPYRVAKTNNPSNYTVRYTGSWTGCRNVEKKKNCLLGLAGISVTTATSGASIKISFEGDQMHHPFKRLKVYHQMDTSTFKIVPKDSQFTYRYDSLGYSEFNFTSSQDSLELSFIKNNSAQTNFTLYGLEVENDDTGFAYHSVGVNGADVPAYLRCNLLAQHAKSVKPDLVIFSIGINDAYTTRFNKKAFINNYDSLISRFRSANPDISIIFTTNNDSYYRRRSVNENGTKVQTAMKELATKHNAAVWDLFEIMGGLDSIRDWEKYGLAQTDKIHFTRAGYKLVGDLFFSALIKSYEQHIKALTKK